MRLTLPQQDVYFEQLLFPDDPIYNIGAKIRIEGVIDRKILAQAYEALIRQHDAFRTVFSQNAENASATVLETYSDELGYVDFSDHESPEDAAREYIQKEFIRPFAIFSGRFLHHFVLVKVRTNFHYLFSVYHHIITDGWGTSLMFQRLVENYNEILEQGTIVSRYPFSYKDFVANDEAYQQSEDYQKDKAYWKEKFDSLPENIFEKINYKGRQNQSSRQAIYLKRPLYNQVNELAKNCKSSTFYILLAVLYTYFGKKHRIPDLAIGLPVLNRSKSTFKKTVGLFMGISPLRLTLDMDASFIDLLDTIKKQLRQDYRHQRFPLGKLIQELKLFQEKSKLFNITLSYEKQNYANNFGDTKTTVIPLTHQSERVALAIYIREFDEAADVKIDFDYNLHYFDEAGISQVTSHFTTLLEEVLNHPEKKLSELQYLSKKETVQLLTDFNDTEVAYASDKTLLDIFDQQVKKHPDKIAVTDDHEQYSYAALNTLSNQIATFLSTHPDGKNTHSIGVLLERSATMIATLLGILKSGKSYIPLDPKFPEERLNYIIAHSELKILISDQPTGAFNFQEIEVLELKEVLQQAQRLAIQITWNCQATDTAYIIYTSGSTGQPKGVAIGHQSLLNFLLSMRQKPGIQSSDSLFAVTTYSFDISILEFFVPLIAGASVFIADNETLANPDKIMASIAKNKPSIIQATPSFYQLLFNAGWQGDKNLKVLCGGDLLSKDLADQLLQKCSSLWNMYGPTETTIWSSIKQITHASEASNIGSPIANTRFYVLDEYQQLLPVGSSGILYIGGDGLAKGYFKAAELTQQKFIPNPFEKGTLLYDTSDLVRWNERGEVVFLGRNDNQVKIRGYRIELEEIESRLNLIPEIKEAIVVPKKNKNQEARLVAYIIKEQATFQEENCIAILEQQLPRYMVPYTIIAVEAFPLTPNKKVDRKALMQREIQNGRTTTLFKKPSTPLEEKMLQYWKETLQYEGTISTTDNYFALGGHSLNAVKLLHLINRDWSYNIGLKTIFDYPTIGALSDYLTNEHIGKMEKIPKVPIKEYYVITPSQYQIWLASQNQERAIAYNMVAAFRVEGVLHPEKINHAIRQLLLKHEILRTNFVEKEGQVYQIIHTIEHTDFNLSHCELEKAAVAENIEAYVNQPFDLERDLLIKMRWIQSNEKESTLVFCVHHIIMDGWSLEYFTSEFVEYYKSFPTTLIPSETAIQYKDYAEFLVADLAAKAGTSFWGNYLEGYRFKESFVADNISSANKHQGAHSRFELTLEETAVLKQFLKQQKTTAHNFLLAVLNVLLFKFSHCDDVVLGTINAGRDRPELNQMIGMFVETLPLRTKMNGTQDFATILKKIQENILQLDHNRHIPSQFVKKTWFDCILAFQNPDFSLQHTIKLEDANWQYFPVEVNYSRLPLLFNFFESAEILNVTLLYNSEKYTSASIELIWLKYKKLIMEVIEKPLIAISELDILLDFEKEKTIDIEFDF